MSWGHTTVFSSGLCPLAGDSSSLFRPPPQTTYTGVYKKGGPSTFDEQLDLGSLLDRAAKK